PSPAVILTHFPSTTVYRSQGVALQAPRDGSLQAWLRVGQLLAQLLQPALRARRLQHRTGVAQAGGMRLQPLLPGRLQPAQGFIADRKSTRLNSSHVKISYA